MEFVHHNYLERVVPTSHASDTRTFEVFHRAALAASDEGELLINVPTHHVKPTGGAGMRQIKLAVYYSLVRPQTGLRFILPDPIAYPNRSPRMLHRPRVCLIADIDALVFFLRRHVLAESR